MKTRKRTAFWTTEMVLVGLYLVTLFVGKDVLAGGLGVAFVSALVGNAFVYIGGQVAQAWQRSAHFRPELVGKDE